MALFGYPQAQENDGERAVRAALAIQRALVDLNARNAVTGAPELAARIGLESGRVVVDSTGEVYGDAPNVAARVQSVAAPGEVWITLGVHRQIAGLFVAEDKGAAPAEGVPETAQLYPHRAASGGGWQPTRRLAAAPTPLVGRGEELDILTRRWERARRGEGQLTLIVGEPGLGKSRLIEEFRVRLAETPHTWVEWASSQLLQNTPLHPIAEWGRARFGGAEVRGEKRFAELEAALGSVGLDPTEYAPLLAPVIDAPLAEGRVPKLSPEELRSRQLAALSAWLLAGARTQPIVLAFEDLHWADPTSLDVLQALAERGAQAPLLIIATTRPEFRPPWKLRSHHGVISLAPLDAGEIVRMVGEIATRHALSKDVIAGVSERSGGVPLFVEEVTRLLLERGEAGGVQAIPPTLQQSLAARLDRLGSAREIAQIGAVLGRGFPHALLQAVAGLDEPALRAALDRLADAELLFVEGVAPHANYRFKHALIQDAAYDSLLKSRRQTLHRRAAEVLLASPSPEAEALAHHFTLGGQTDLAIEWWGKAGDQALRRSAFQEAIAHLGKAIAMADKAEGDKAADGFHQNRQLHVAYGNALIAARGFGAPETLEAFAKARESAYGENNAPERFAADYGLYAGAYTHGDLPQARAYAETLLRNVADRPDSPEAGVAQRAIGLTHWFAGEYREARDHLERALAVFQPGRDDDLAFRFGWDAGVGATLYLALTLWPLGDVERAVSLVRGARTRIAGLSHIGTHATGNMHTALFELMRGSLTHAAPNAVELARIAREHNLPEGRAFGLFLEGAAATERRTLGERLTDMRHAVELLREENDMRFPGLIKIALAEAEARAGDPVRAAAILDEALATCERIRHRAFDAELHRVRGEMLLRSDPTNPAPAEAAFGRAIEIASEQGTRSFGLRAALSLAKLYQSTARPSDAHAVLAPAIEGFAPTSAMPEIAEAAALLTALAATDEVKAAAAQQRRLTQLHVAYGNALIAARGYGAPETTEAFARAREFGRGYKDAPGRLATDRPCSRGRQLRACACQRCEQLRLSSGTSEAKPDSPEASVAHVPPERPAGSQPSKRASAGSLRKGARLVPTRPRRRSGLPDLDRTLGAAAMANLATPLWALGEVDRATRSSIACRRGSPGPPPMPARSAPGRTHRPCLALMRRDYVRAAQNGVELARLACEHDLPMFRAVGFFLQRLATAA